MTLMTRIVMIFSDTIIFYHNHLRHLRSIIRDAHKLKIIFSKGSKTGGLVR
jgi:hypothetical protein